MPLFALYLIKLSIGLSAAWLFYQLFLRRLTFYSWNRWYLLGYSLLSFFIPLINVAGAVGNDSGHEATVIKYIPVIGNYKPPAVGAWDLIFWALALGTLFLMVRLLSRWLSLRRIRRQARLLSDEGVMMIYQVDEPIIPFSFGNAVYINANQHTEKEWSAIILHEYVHIRQRHTLDILLAELCCALNWYNPFAWLIRHAIRQNLEFIADSKVLEKGLDKKGYQYHLLKVIGEPRYRLANNFNFSSLKKRIIMMNKIRSARLQLVKFLFLLPLFAVLLVAFRSQHKEAALLSLARNGHTGRTAGLLMERPGDGNSPVSLDPLRGVPGKGTAGKPVGMRVDRPAAMHRHLIDTLPLSRDTLMGPAGVMLTIHDVDWTYNVKGIDSLRKHLPDVLYMIDGIQTPRERVAKVDPNQIGTISILKGDQTTAYGAQARDGVILICTRAWLEAHPDKDQEEKNTMIMRADTITVSPGNMDSGDRIKLESYNIRMGGKGYKGLLILDGKEIPGEVLSKLNPQVIDHMEVLKGEAATKRYGKKGKDGVILITSKK